MVRITHDSLQHVEMTPSVAALINGTAAHGL